MWKIIIKFEAKIVLKTQYGRRWPTIVKVETDLGAIATPCCPCLVHHGCGSSSPGVGVCTQVGCFLSKNGCLETVIFRMFLVKRVKWSIQQQTRRTEAKEKRSILFECPPTNDCFRMPFISHYLEAFDHLFSSTSPTPCSFPLQSLLKHNHHQLSSIHHDSMRPDLKIVFRTYIKRLLTVS